MDAIFFKQFHQLVHKGFFRVVCFLGFDSNHAPIPGVLLRSTPGCCFVWMETWKRRLLSHGLREHVVNEA
ncbi:MAG: hypothetical protein FWF96_01855, partial [Kiritimatiellaeota bacterium]|nr:hypothetical protein [Kiritimatiellota bacterium]